MRLLAPTQAPNVLLVDVQGKPVSIGKGRKLLLSLFREVTCPFCNFRVYELTHNYQGFSALGVDIVAVFHSSRDDVLKFVARHPRPFRMVADPEARAHQAFGVESSRLRKLKAMMLRMPALLRGMCMSGLRGMKTGSLMPADFLIDERGKVVETYYGTDAGDHIPMERLELFAACGTAAKAAA